VQDGGAKYSRPKFRLGQGAARGNGKNGCRQLSVKNLPSDHEKISKDFRT